MSQMKFRRLTSLLVIFTFVVGFLTPAIPSVKAETNWDNAITVEVAKAIVDGVSNGGTGNPEVMVKGYLTAKNVPAHGGSNTVYVIADEPGITDPSDAKALQIPTSSSGFTSSEVKELIVNAEVGSFIGVIGKRDLYYGNPSIEKTSLVEILSGGAPDPEPALGLISIADARTKSNNTEVIVEGVVTADNSAIGGGNLSTYIQDDTAGINLYSSSSQDLKEGDKVKVQGQLAEYKGLKELIPTSVEVMATNQQLPQTKSITLADLETSATAEQLEGQLVKVTGYVSSVPSSPAGGGFNVSFIDSDYNSTMLRVMEETGAIGALEAGKWYEVTAIVSQYNTYQILPRKSEDIQLLADQPKAPTAEGEYPAVVANVVDGDTVNLASPILNSTKVRFVNIDTPETFNASNTDPSRTEINANQKEHGEGAKTYMNTLLKAGDEIIVKIGEEPMDAYGRLLGQVIRQSDGLNTNLEMVRHGKAATYFIAPVGDDATYNEFQAAVKEAKDNKVGIWNETNPLLELPFVFRTNDDNGIFDKYVGNSDTKRYVSPDKWAEVPVEKRIFFWSEEDAKAAGYTAISMQVEDPNGSLDNISLQLLSLNDLHGKIDQVYKVDTNGDETDETVARMDYVAAYLKEREATNPNTLIVHAGDMIGGSSPVSALLQDEPTIEIMEEIGFDVGTVGNHEFDEGTTELLRMVNGGEHPEGKGTENYDGMNFPILCANCISNETSEPILPAYSIQEVEGTKVGFIGVNTTATASMVIPSGIQDITFTDEAEAVNKAVGELQNQGVNAIIVLAHMPASQSGAGATDAAANLANAVNDEVDVIFAAHNHEVVDAIVDNKLIVQAYDYGKAFGDVDLEIDPTTADVVKKEAEIVYVDHNNVTPDATVTAILEKYENRVVEIMNEVVGFSEIEMLGGYGVKGPFGDNALGNLIADGMAWSMKSDFALMNGGGIRDDIDAGEITWAELFNVQPFGNTLVKVEITGADLEKILNAQISEQYGPEASIGGFEYTWDTVTNKVIDIYLLDGSEIDKAKTYTVTVNNYMYEHGRDKYKLRALGENPVQGPIDLDATVDFVKSFNGTPLSYEAEGRFSEIVAGDTTAPVTEITLQEADFSDGSYLEEVVVELGSTDAENTVLRTEYSLDGGETWVKYRAPITIAEDGKTTIQYRAIDTARNAEEIKTLNVVVVAPTLTNVENMVSKADANHGVKTSTLSHIENIKKELEKGKVQHAYKELGKLQQHLDKQNEKSINAVDKADIIKLMNYIVENNKL
jgi:2',3'-cyclic-nucleotide 2'-phosphodiesterase/3'-nucleotidase/5'-nucleotidase